MYINIHTCSPEITYMCIDFTKNAYISLNFDNFYDIAFFIYRKGHFNDARIWESTKISRFMQCHPKDNPPKCDDFIV